MPRSIKQEDWDLLTAAAAVASEGLDAAQVANRLGVSYHSLRYVAQKHGFEIRPTGYALVSKLGGISFSDLAAQGEIEPSASTEAAPAAV